jgi:hypothetical protein
MPLPALSNGKRYMVMSSCLELVSFCWELVGYYGYIYFAFGKQFGVLIGCVFGAASVRIKKFA